MLQRIRPKPPATDRVKKIDIINLIIFSGTFIRFDKFLAGFDVIAEISQAIRKGKITGSIYSAKINSSIKKDSKPIEALANPLIFSFIFPPNNKNFI